jgi:large subunit ribosomal protein L12e
MIFSVKHDGNLALDEILQIARVVRERSMAKTFAGTVKEVLGTCVSVGCTVDGQSPRDLQKKITDGEVEIPEK